MTDHVPQHLACGRDDNGRKHGSDDAANAHGALHVPGQEARHLVCDRAEFARGDLQVLRAHNPVDEANREVEALRILEDTGELGGGCIHRDLCRLRQPAAHERNGLRREVGEGICGEDRRHGGGHVTQYRHPTSVR